MGSLAPSLLDQNIHIVTVPEEIRQSGQPTPEIIAAGAGFLHKDGIVILRNAVCPSHLDTLNDKLSPEALEIANDPAHHFNFGTQTRNMDQAPPPTRSLMFKDVWCNPFAAAILAATLGPKPVIHYANGNTALKAPPTARQPVHSDCEFAHPVYFPFAYVINIPLVDVSHSNGATEVWPGSHHVSAQEAHNLSAESEGQLTIRGEFLEARRKHSPPIQACTIKGDIVIRDLRLWHAGMPNLTDEPRVMLAFVACPSWWQSQGKIVLPESVRELVDGWNELSFSADWVEGEVNHKKLSSEGIDLETGSTILKENKAYFSRWPDYTPRWF